MRAPSCLVWVLLLTACAGDAGDGVDPSLIQPIGRGDLLITVRERGEIKAARDTRISSQLEGRATLIELIPEGTVVSAGEVVAKLDVSGILEKRDLQAIAVAKAEAALEQARKAVEIVEKELTAAERTAETRLQIAELRLQRFIGQEMQTAKPPPPLTPIGSQDAGVGSGTNQRVITALQELIADDALAFGSSGNHLVDRIREILGSEGNLKLEMGDLAIQVLQQIDAIGLARINLNLSDRTLVFSEKLFKEGFYTENELAHDRIDYKRNLAAQTIAWNNLLLLVNYSLPETLLTLKLELENSGLNLESVRATNEARRVREEAELRSIEAEFGLATAQLNTWTQQVENGVLRAPAAGLVVYGRWDWDEPVYEGMEVRERQEVIILPDITSMVADIKVPESQIGRLAVGQRATLMMDAFPNRLFSGSITYVSSLPDPGPRGQVVKVYIVSVLIDGANEGGSLRPGMNATVIIEVGTVHDALTIPLSALERKGDAHFVWRASPAGPVAAPVTLGANNLTHVEVAAGLAEGDRIYLVRPPGLQIPDAQEAVPGGVVGDAK